MAGSDPGKNWNTMAARAGPFIGTTWVRETDATSRGDGRRLDRTGRVVPMTIRALRLIHDPKHDGFLFAQIGDDWRGMQVSVLSAVARLGVDPWQEASKLEGLTAEEAGQRPDTLLSDLPGVPAMGTDYRAIAVRLVSLSPGRVQPRPANGITVSAAPNRSTIAIIALFFFVVLIHLAAFCSPPPDLGGESTATHPASMQANP